MDNLSKQKKPINEIMIILKDIRSEISQIKRDIVFIKNSLDELKDDSVIVPAVKTGWFY